MPTLSAILKLLSGKILIFLLVLIFPSLIYSQSSSYRFSRLDISQGLSNNQILSIYRDGTGYVWFGTQSGLNRWDGHAVRVFRHDPGNPVSLNDDCISQILEGPGHRLWISTRAGFCIYDPMTERFDRDAGRWLHQAGIDADSILDIRKDPAGCYWFLAAGKGGGLYKFDPAITGDQQRALHLQPGSGDPAALHSSQPTAFAWDGNNGFWVVFPDGLMQDIDARTGRVVATSALVHDLFPGRSMYYRIYVDANKDCWLYTSDGPRGLLFVSPAQDLCRHIMKGPEGKGLNTDLVTGIQQDEKGMIWIATDHGGINILDKKNGSVRWLLSRDDDDKSLSQNCINALYKDSTGIVWIGTYKRGLSYYHEDNLKFPLYRRRAEDPHSLPFDDVNRFVEDEKGHLWIGTNGGGLIEFNRQTGRFTRYRHDANDSNSLSNDVIVTLYMDRHRKLWIGTYFGGLDCFDGKTFQHHRHSDADSNSLADDRVWELLEDDQDRLWVGTLAAGLDRFDRSQQKFIHYKPGTGNRSVHSTYISELKQDRYGSIWIGTAVGIDVLDPAAGVFRHYAHDPADPSGLSNNNIMSIFEDSRGLIWIGTRDGLNCYDRKTDRFTVYRRPDGLPENTILTILEDDDHRLWFSTPNGLCNLRLNTEQRTGGIQPHFRSYDESYGLQGREFNENAALRTRAGELVFGGPNGFNLFLPGNLHCRSLQPKLVLTDLQIFNKNIGIGDTIDGHIPLTRSLAATPAISLHYNENIFSIGFTALDFLHEQKLKYAYKLVGFNQDWLISDGGPHRAVFTNLDPGSYTLQVRTGTDDGIWDPNLTELKILILPPWWKTPLAYLAYIVLLAGTLWMGRRLLLQRARMRFAIEQERKEAQRLHELDMMKIKFFTNVSHEFRTPLSLILAPLEKMLRSTADNVNKTQLGLIHRNARRLLNMVNQLLDFRKLEVQELRLQKTDGDIVRFVGGLSHSFTDIAEKKNVALSFNTGIASLRTDFDHDKLERILFNLLSNAFKFTPEYGQVTVSADLLPASMPGGPPMFSLEVADTGIGIEKDRQERIFERFFQNEMPGSIVNQGSGIGLAITREFVRLHEGSIRVDSEPGKGSRFTVLLPLATVCSHPATPANANSVSGPGPANPTHTSQASAPAESAAAAPSRRPTILLVEDNEDFRFYLKDNLREYFTILEAPDGLIGWQRTLGAHPELVVSDISMPQMNGIDLCRKIKMDSRTANIPVILLTALAGEDQHLKGLETGASDYLTKPFNFEILLSKIRNLLSQQEQARKTFSRQLQTAPTESNILSPDEQFLRRALDLVEQNMSNADFSVEEMSRQLFCSRVALYKKLLHLTGKTPIEFIRTTRLKRAVQLLEKERFTVAEIAYEVGFNNPKNFSRYFKTEYGMLPSVFQRNALTSDPSDTREQTQG